MNRKLGVDDVFLEFDSTARKNYEDRVRTAQGVVEGVDNK
jgi:hypothetical protein